jgi:hypothetical protein
MHSSFNRFVMRFLAPASITLAAAAMAPMVARAQIVSPTPSPTVASLLAAEDARFQAQIRHDAAAVDQALADELTYTHAVGRVQTKADYLNALRGRRAPYRSIIAEGRAARVSGDLGVTHGSLAMEVGENRLGSSYLAAYVWRSGRWQLLYWQTSPAPPADGVSPPPK